MSVVLIGLALAVPLGMILTNQAWGLFAGSLHLDRFLPFPWTEAGLAAAGLLAIGAAAALPLGHHWARQPLMRALRRQ